MPKTATFAPDANGPSGVTSNVIHSPATGCAQAIGLRTGDAGAVRQVNERSSKLQGTRNTHTFWRGLLVAPLPCVAPVVPPRPASYRASAGLGASIAGA